MHLNGTTWVISFSSLSYYHTHPDQVQDQPTTQVDLFLQNHNKKIFILLFYTYTVISKISNLMQKCVSVSLFTVILEQHTNMAILFTDEN